MGSNLAVGALVAGMMGNISNVDQLEKGSKKDNDQYDLEQNIAAVLESIEEHAPDKVTALAQMKAFLSRLSGEDGSWSPEIQSWISGEMDAANSYQQPSDILAQLEADTKQLQLDQSVLNIDENARAGYKADEANVEDEMAKETAWYNGLPWYDQAADAVAYGVVMAGYVAKLGWDKYAITQEDNAITQELYNVNYDKHQVANDEAELENDPKLRDMLNILGTDASLMNSNAGEQITSNQKTINEIEAIDDSINGMIKSFASQHQVKG